ncbi:MAG: 3-hydroxyacyl-CoA dehydrogenase NAD-binding domain-containing protein [Rhodospirillaceae bacterium]|nr:3-hydroxyacyl-CoA dehydrogenase NAD-binding domain-containing protein [Rhodospirillaceae bacterium]
MTDLVSLSRRDGVAVVTIDHPPVNAISHGVRAGLLAAVDQIRSRPGAIGAVLACAGRTFAAGSDIREFDAPVKEPHLSTVIAALEALPVPVMAAIHGTALGGGFELALGCHYRIASPDAKVGLPEINLGLIPGAGGTQRLPRLIGIAAALEWILGGKHVAAADALAAGAIDELAAGDLLEAAVAAVRRIAQQKAIRRTSALDIPKPAPADVFTAQRQAVAKRARGFEAPPAAIDAVEAAATLPFAEGMTRERAISDRLKASLQSRAQRHLFFGEREVARIPDIGKEVAARTIDSVGIVGAGTMGRGIAMACLNGGLSVTLVDRTNALADAGRASIAKSYARDVEKKRLSEEAMAQRLERLTAAGDMEALAQADLVIEAAFEDMAIKQSLFRDLDRICRPGAILASNTSTLDLNAIAAVTRRPADVIGLHFFSPAHVMRLLEVVRGRATAADVVVSAMGFGKRIGKVAVLSGVCFGFIGNRMFEGYVRESQRLLLEGATPAQVDRALTNFGMAMGPCAVIDLAGVDVSFLTREGNRPNLPPDPSYCLIGDKLHHLGRFGQKAGRGFYRYESGAAVSDPEVEALIRSEADRMGISRREIGPEDIVARCIYPLISEAAQILDEGIALRAVDIDVVWASGYGWPRYRGGPLFHADAMGLQAIVDGIHGFARDLGNDYGYWTPSALLAKLAAEGKLFKDWSRS